MFHNYISVFYICIFIFYICICVFVFVYCVERGDILIESPDLSGQGVPRVATNRFLMLCNVDPRLFHQFLLTFNHNDDDGGVT